MVYAWDVVNEAVDIDRQTKKWELRKNIWYPTLPNYIDLAFQYAREADPDALLFYNDYAVTTQKNKALRIFEMVKGLLDRGVPIDGVGF